MSQREFSAMEFGFDVISQQIQEDYCVVPMEEDSAARVVDNVAEPDIVPMDLVPPVVEARSEGSCSAGVVDPPVRMSVEQPEAERKPPVFDDYIYIDDIQDEWLLANIDHRNRDFDTGLDRVVPPSGYHPYQSPSVDAGASVGAAKQETVVTKISGLREVPLKLLSDAGKGIEKMKSEGNDKWSLRRADLLRAALGWDMTVAFGDLPLTKVDELLANLFSRVVKVCGEEYPAESLVNMMNGYNRILRRASDLRSLKGEGVPLGKDFNIKKHPAFTATRLVLSAAIKKTGKDGTNKERVKVPHITEVMEVAVLSDIDHQVLNNVGCQKRVVFYLLVRCGIRGGGEIWDLKRIDLVIKIDDRGSEYVQFRERESKSNGWTIDRCKEEQFRMPYHTYEEDFVFTVKQYIRHMPPLVEGTKDDLFLGAITNPVGNVWYNRVHKVSKDRASKWLSTMLTLVGLPGNLFSNKSGRATLVTRMAASGVPDHIGMMVTGHHTQDGYLRYDRTKHLKMEAAIQVAANPKVDYQTALAGCSKRFVEESMVGTTENLKPLTAPKSAYNLNPLLNRVNESSSSGSNLQPSVPMQIQERPENIELRVSDLSSSKLDVWHKHYDGIDWEAAAKSDPRVLRALGGPSTVNAFNNSIAGGSFHGCHIHLHVLPENQISMMQNVTQNMPANLMQGKENSPVVQNSSMVQHRLMPNEFPDRKGKGKEIVE